MLIGAMHDKQVAPEKLKERFLFTDTFSSQEKAVASSRPAKGQVATQDSAENDTALSVREIGLKRPQKKDWHC